MVDQSRVILVRRWASHRRKHVWFLQCVDCKVYTADFTQFASKGPAGGVLDAAVEVNKGLKIAAGYIFIYSYVPIIYSTVFGEGLRSFFSGLNASVEVNKDLKLAAGCAGFARFAVC